MVDFVRIPDDANGNYVEVEQDIWKPMHQAMIDDGKMDAWFLYRIPYPGGTDAEYHYATVRVYSDLSQLENPMSGLGDLFAKVHPGKNADEAFEMTTGSRDLIKTYGLVRWESFFAEDMAEPAKIIQVVYFRVPMDKWGDYQDMETKYFHPTHKAEIKAGKRTGWDGYRLAQPMGMDMPFQYVAVDHYKDWAQYTSQPSEADYEGVFDGDEMEMREQVFSQTVTLARLEEWRLVDYVMKQ